MLATPRCINIIKVRAIYNKPSVTALQETSVKLVTINGHNNFNDTQIHCSACDIINRGQSLRLNNNIPACRSEVVAFVEYLTGLVEDFETDFLSRDDLIALFDKYAGPNSFPGKFLHVCMFAYFFSNFYTNSSHSLSNARKHKMHNMTGV